MTDDNREAAAILRGLKRQVDDLRRSVAEEGLPNILRFVNDRMTADDPTNARENDADVADRMDTSDATDAREYDATATDRMNADDVVDARQADASATDGMTADDTVATTVDSTVGPFTTDDSLADGNDITG